MSNNETILIELGFFTRDSKFEEFKTNFGYGWSSEDLKEAIDVAGENTSNVRNFLMEILWLKVVEDSSIFLTFTPWWEEDYSFGRTIHTYLGEKYLKRNLTAGLPIRV